MTGEGLARIVEQIYEAAADPGRIGDLGPTIGREFDTDSAIIYLALKPNPRLVFAELLSTTGNFDAWARSSYAEHYHTQDELFSRALRKSTSGIVISQELIADADFARTEFCADFCERIGFFHVLGTYFEVDGLVGAIGLHKPRRAGEFGEADRRKMRQLVPHLKRAFQIHHRMAALTRERDIAVEVMDGLAVGLLFVTADARLLFANRIAEGVLQLGQALSLSRGRLRAVDHCQQQALERLIGEAAQTSAGKGMAAGGVLPVAMPNGGQLFLLISPFRSVSIGYGPALPAAVVMFSDPESEPRVPEQVLRSLFGLTAAETRLVTALLAGQGLSEYARGAGLSINTAKSQMRQVFAKTGHDRQADLVRALAANPVMRLARR